MKTITKTVYEFEELSDDAKEKAREWFLSGGDESQFAFEHIVEDAKNIGLRIVSLDDRRANQGDFIGSATECADKIIKEHGAECATYKTAEAFLEARDKIVSEWPRDENGEFELEYDLDQKLDEVEKEFSHNLLEDYRVMLEKEIEYQTSDEQVDESIMANGYTFTETGKREG